MTEDSQRVRRPSMTAVLLVTCLLVAGFMAFTPTASAAQQCLPTNSGALAMNCAKANGSGTSTYPCGTPGERCRSVYADGQIWTNLVTNAGVGQLYGSVAGYPLTDGCFFDIGGWSCWLSDSTNNVPSAATLTWTYCGSVTVTSAFAVGPSPTVTMTPICSAG